MPAPQPLPRILVVDDQPQICRLAKDVLEPSGYGVEIAHDGRELLERYRAGSHALLVLDTLLVQLSGLEVVTKLRDRGDLVPIILMFGPRRDARRVEHFAFTYRVQLLRKPFGVGDLRAAVARALRENRPD
jgi:DNA-binding response OmpR family regulator